MSLSDFESQIIDHAESQADEEVCGLIVLNEDLSISVERMINEHSSPDKCFSISPQKFIDYKINKIILGVYHSHPKTDENPSDHDINTSEELGFPYLIYSLLTNSFFLYCPESYEPEEILGRPYIKGFYECTSVLRDYFYINLQKNISKYHKNYWLPESDKDANQLLNEILNKNFKKVTKQESAKHDVIVFQLKESKRCHVGVYLGNDYFVHQPNKKLSCKQMLDERWQSKIKEVYRHNSLV
jgi:proteasome lid subunit RPN8/RPN11